MTPQRWPALARWEGQDGNQRDNKHHPLPHPKSETEGASLCRCSAAPSLAPNARRRGVSLHFYGTPPPPPPSCPPMTPTPPPSPPTRGGALSCPPPATATLLPQT